MKNSQTKNKNYNHQVSLDLKMMHYVREGRPERFKIEEKSEGGRGKCAGGKGRVPVLLATDEGVGCREGGAGVCRGGLREGRGGQAEHARRRARGRETKTRRPKAKGVGVGGVCTYVEHGKTEGGSSQKKMGEE